MIEEVKKSRVVNNKLKPFFNEEKIEIGVDEVGRGPLFGRVYAAAVILPKDDTFDHSKMKDSKKFHSKKKLIDTADYIKEKAIAWSIHYEDEKTIDDINILQATQKTMHKCIDSLMKKNDFKKEDTLLLIDGNYFKTFTYFNTENKRFEQLDHTCIEGGDNKYSAIAAASILAKVERDKYIEDLCSEYPDLIEKYSLNTNKGYGSKKHIEGIKQHGITVWHRRSFGICSSFI